MPIFPSYHRKNPKRWSGFYHTSDALVSRGATAVPAVDRLNAIPIVFGRDGTITDIGIEITANEKENKSARLGIYESLGTSLPGALLLDAGEVSLAAVAVVEVSGLTQAVTADKLYWLAVVYEDTPTCRTMTYPVANVIGATTCIGSPLPGVYVSHTYGALPDPFGTYTGGVWHNAVGVKLT